MGQIKHILKGYSQLVTREYVHNRARPSLGILLPNTTKTPGFASPFTCKVNVNSIFNNEMPKNKGDWDIKDVNILSLSSVSINEYKCMPASRGEDKNDNQREDKQINAKLLERKANLGKMIETLQIHVPSMLKHLIPRENTSSDIILRLLPHQFPNIPLVKGYLMYSSTMKAIQKILLLFYLNPNSQIHIMNMSIVEPTKSMSSNELIRLSIKENPIQYESDDSTIIANQDTSKYTTKIKIRWRTCLSGCPHLQNKETRSAKWGSYSLDHFDWTKMLKSSNPLQSLALLEAKKQLEGLAKTLEPLTTSMSENSEDNSGNVGRVLTGVFIFELDAANEQIAVLTVDNVDILESKEMDFNNGGFLAA